MKAIKPTLPPSAVRVRRASLIAITTLAGIVMLAIALYSLSGRALRLSESRPEEQATAGGELLLEQSLTSATGMSEQDVRETNALLATAAAATQQYREVDRARSDGYRPVTGVLAGSAMHFVSQYALADDGFDVTRPEVLLYDEVASGRLELAGVAYLLPRRSANEAAPAAFGPLAHWHAHHYRWPCLTVRTEGPPVTIDRSDVACRAGGNLVFPTRFWMLHVWLFRVSRDGVFSELNRSIGTSETLFEGTVNEVEP